MNWNAILQQAEQLAWTDLDSAIRHIEAARSEGGFYPQGGWFLSELLKEAGRHEERLQLLGEIFHKVPSFYRVWGPLFQEQELDPRSKATLSSQMLDVLAQAQADAIPRWLSPLAPDLLVFSDKEDIAPFFQLLSATLGDSLPTDTLDALLRIRCFLSRLRSFLADNPEEVIDSWRLVVHSEATWVCAVSSDCLDINLSVLGIRAISRWVHLFSKPLLTGIQALLPTQTYSDDLTIGSWATARPKDALACHYLTLLRSLVLREGKVAMTRRPSAANVVPGSLLVRVGNVELSALWTHLTERSGLHDPVRSAMEALAGASSSEAPQLAAQPWWPRADPVKNIIQLATNAGFYAAPSDAADAFTRWAEEYLDAMERGELLLYVPDLVAKFAALRPGLRTKQPYVLNQAEVLSLLFRERVVIVTPYVHEIVDQLRSGRLFALWSEMGFAPNEAHVVPVAAPMSVWPYQPHRSWEQTFDLLCEEVAQAIQESGAGILVASCGCYGLPLCNRMNARLGVTAIYEGQVTNAYFGVATSATKKSWLYQKYGGSPHWIDSALAKRVPEIVRIDQGRYA